MQTKLCAKCRLEKPVGEFYLNRGKPGSYCKPCHKSFSVLSTAVNIEKRRASKRAWVKKNAECLKMERRANHLRVAYGMTPEEYDALYESQGGKCAICGIHRDTYIRSLHLDHNHLTGTKRGLLCPGCNQVLGWGKDDPTIFRKAAEYLEKHT